MWDSPGEWSSFRAGRCVTDEDAPWHATFYRTPPPWGMTGAADPPLHTNQLRWTLKVSDAALLNVFCAAAGIPSRRRSKILSRNSLVYTWENPDRLSSALLSTPFAWRWTSGADNNCVIKTQFICHACINKTNAAGCNQPCNWTRLMPGVRYSPNAMYTLRICEQNT